jgi:hypothetical protein
MDTEWQVICANGHRSYERVRDVPPDDVEFTPCPKCGAPRRGEVLPPVV